MKNIIEKCDIFRR